MAPIAIEDEYWKIKYLQLPFRIQPNTYCQLNLVCFYAGNFKITLPFCMANYASRYLFCTQSPIFLIICDIHLMPERGKIDKSGCSYVVAWMCHMSGSFLTSVKVQNTQCGGLFTNSHYSQYLQYAEYALNGNPTRINALPEDDELWP